MPHEYVTYKNITDRNKSYWIRTIPADHCSNFVNGGTPDERQGILSYNDIKAIPSTARAEINTTCRDEPYEKLRPWLYWDITPPNENEKQAMVDNSFEIGTEIPKPPDGRPFPCDRFARWSMGNEPMFLNFSDPTILNLRSDPSSFPDRKVVVNYPQDSWVYMIITGMYENGTRQRDVDRAFIPAAHPVSQSDQLGCRPFSLFLTPKLIPGAIRCIFTATTSPSSSNPIKSSTGKTSTPTSIIPPAATLSYCLPKALSPSHSKPIIQAPGPFTAISHGMLPPASPSKFWRGRMMHWPYWRPIRHGLERLTQLVQTGTSGSQNQKTFIMLNLARSASRMIRGCKPCCQRGKMRGKTQGVISG